MFQNIWNKSESGVPALPPNPLLQLQYPSKKVFKKVGQNLTTKGSKSLDRNVFPA